MSVVPISHLGSGPLSEEEIATVMLHTIQQRLAAYRYSNDGDRPECIFLSGRLYWLAHQYGRYMQCEWRKDGLGYSLFGVHVETYCPPGDGLEFYFSDVCYKFEELKEV